MTPAYVYALLSKDVYKSNNAPLSCELRGRGWLRHELTAHEEAHFAKGFYGRIYWNKKRNEIVVAFRGTVRGEMENWKKNFEIVFLKKKGRYHDNANDLVDRAKKASRGFNLRANYRLTLTGHSLGGMMAMILAAENPQLRAIAFDSPGVGGVDGIPITEIKEYQESKMDCGGSAGGFNAIFSAGNGCRVTSWPVHKTVKKQYSNIQNIIVSGSALSSLGTHVGHVSALNLKTKACEADELVEVYFSSAPSLPGEYAGHLVRRAVNCAVIELHQITHITEKLRQQVIEIAV